MGSKRHSFKLTLPSDCDGTIYSRTRRPREEDSRRNLLNFSAENSHAIFEAPRIPAADTRTPLDTRTSQFLQPVHNAR